PRIDARTLLVMTLFLVLNIAATALVPSVISVRRATDLAPRRARATRAFGQRLAIVVQVALSVLLLCVTATLLSGFRALSKVAGAGERPAFVVDVSLPESRYASETSQA